ncbi:hypothetical protein DMN91_003141 [Ooceraea biroi]|uniref:Facilitated trehalose transporter Tret1 n=1 Tax=Ooceraea biroi TaxID=2015173 RepID=A0A026WQ15_OOCBI|nr:facilitated trehalose transporter Tret1 [Ooceraea biroi]EZA57781.1 Facilitated trehalose transporter Tret1 [Ooceraea biroi]RLU25049.1 hypothetical protein DMN91_003141 [Ooceraea biroi]
MEATGMISGVPVRQEGRKLWQYLASISASIMAIAVGTALAWTSPVLPQLYEANSWLVINKEQGSWVSSLLALGAMFSAVPSGPMADKLGRKKSLLLLTVPFLLSWAIIVVASSLWLINVARFIVGIGVGTACVLVPTYISEIAEISTRGMLGALFQLALTIGILLAFILGSVMNYTAFTLICALVVVGFLAAFVWMPESPVWLVNQKRKPEATLAMTVLRGGAYDPSEELEEMQREAEQAASRKSSVFDLIRTPAARKALLASLGGMLFQQLSGINAVIFYTVTIFEASGSSIPANIASIIVALVQVVMSAVAALIVDRAGRKPLLMFSSGVMSVSLIALGLYFNLQAKGNDVSQLGWLPLTSLTLFMIAFSVGLGPIPWMLMGELFPAETKAVASGVAVMLNWFLVFLVTKTFPTMNEELGADTTFWIFAAIMAIATVFTYFFVPETKGKSLQEIQEELQNGVQSNRIKAMA